MPWGQTHLSEPQILPEVTRTCLMRCVETQAQGLGSLCRELAGPWVLAVTTVTPEVLCPNETYKAQQF